MEGVLSQYENIQYIIHKFPTPKIRFRLSWTQLGLGQTNLALPISKLGLADFHGGQFWLPIPKKQFSL
jgi:hypothetical protein